MIFDFAPPAPGAPKLEAASEDSIRVLYAAPPGSSHLSFFIREVSEEAEWQDVSEDRGSVRCQMRMSLLQALTPRRATR